MSQLRRYVLTLGLTKSMTMITVICVLMSILLTFSLIRSLYGRDQDMPYFLLIAALVPLVIAPLVSFNFLKLLFKIEALERETRFLATYDELTGLYTRRAFYMHAEQQLAIAKRESKQLAMLVADLDGFKLINDTYGHHAGDMALKLVSNVIKQTARGSDIAGRVGGDEFIFCLPNATEDEALLFGQRLVENVSNASFMYENNQIKLSMSIGLNRTEANNHADIDVMIKEADQALYRAKKQGKNRLAI